MSTETSVTTINSMNAVELFQGNKIEELLNAIATEARSEVPDPSTEKGRERIKSLAYKVAKSKTAIDALGKDLVADWKAKSKEVDAIRKSARERLDALKEEVRQPVTDWENAEAERVGAIKERITEIQNLACEPDHPGEPRSLDDLIQALAQLTSCDIDESFQELRAIAQKAKDDVIASLEGSIAAAEKRKAEADELERLRKEEEARQEAERKRLVAEREAKIAKEAAEKAERKAEEKAVRERQEVERKLMAAKEEQAKAERALADAEEQRLRNIKEQKEAQEKREADLEHRKTINNAAVAAFEDSAEISTHQARQVVEAIARQLVPAVTINY
jgi:DNA repair exonuclease SbcCD ATPase subunit